MKLTPRSSNANISFSVKAALTIAATTWAANTASPSCDTRAAFSAIETAKVGFPGVTMPIASMKIWAPICSATIFELSSIEPDLGALIPFFNLK